MPLLPSHTVHTIGRKTAGTFAVSLLLVFLAAAPAWARQLVIQDFNEQVTVEPDGTLDVTELIEARFTGHWNGIYRTIPVQYLGPGGLNYELTLTPVSITDDAGNKLKYEESRQGRSLKFKIWVPGAEDATRTVVFHYRVRDAIRFLEDHDELYWNVTGNEWDVPIESSSAHIELPADVTGLHAISYTGAFGSRAHDAQVRLSTNAVDVSSTRPLAFHEGLTAVVGWDKGFVHEPSGLSKLAFYLFSNWPLFLPVFAFLVMFWLWWTRGRDPERDSITVQYEPPDKLSPAECGTLVDNEAAMRDITATLVDLAVNGYLTIEQKDQEGLLGLTHHRDYVFHLKRPPAQWDGARAHERAMLGGIFYEGSSILTDSAPNPSQLSTQSPGIQGNAPISGSSPSQAVSSAVSTPPVVENYSAAFRAASDFGETPQISVALSELQNRFYTQLPTIRNCIFDSLMQDGYYLHRPDTVRQGYIGVGAVIGGLMFFLARTLASGTNTSETAWVIAGFLTAAVICGFGWFMPARTLTGARTYAKVLGFEDFLSRVESDRIARMQNAPALFEKFLPYAMALHVEKKWVQAFQGMAIEPPRWYQGAYVGAFQPYLFVNDLGVMSSQVGTVMASSPRSVSSGGSGFGGGGGAGGGFGGGGGGGF
jgi:hypothetical protein